MGSDHSVASLAGTPENDARQGVVCGSSQEHLKGLFPAAASMVTSGNRGENKEGQFVYRTHIYNRNPLREAPNLNITA